jgi:hypothetical protein
MLSVPYIKGLSEKFQSIGSRYNITTLFKTKNTIGGFLRKMKPNDLRDKPQCIYRIPCKCDIEYIGETSRTLGVRIKEHIYITLGIGILIDQNWPRMILKKAVRLIRTREVFYSLNPILFIENTEKQLITLLTNLM